jgi:hypothetical protein
MNFNSKGLIHTYIHNIHVFKGRQFRLCSDKILFSYYDMSSYGSALGKTRLEQ